VVYFHKIIAEFGKDLHGSIVKENTMHRSKIERRTLKSLFPTISWF